MQSCMYTHLLVHHFQRMGRQNGAWTDAVCKWTHGWGLSRVEDFAVQSDNCGYCIVYFFRTGSGIGNLVIWFGLSRVEDFAVQSDKCGYWIVYFFRTGSGIGNLVIWFGVCSTASRAQLSPCRCQDQSRTDGRHPPVLWPRLQPHLAIREPAVPGPGILPGNLSGEGETNGAVNKHGYAPYINFHSSIHSRVYQCTVMPQVQLQLFRHNLLSAVAFCPE